MKPFTPQQVRFLQEIILLQVGNGRVCVGRDGGKWMYVLDDATRLRVKARTFDALMERHAFESVTRGCRIVGHYTTWRVTPEAKAQLAKQVAEVRK